MTNNEDKPDTQDDTKADRQTAEVEVIHPPSHYDPSKEGLVPASFDEVFAALITDPKRYGAAVVFRFATAWAKEQISRTREATKRADEEARRNRALTEDATNYRERVAELESAERERKHHKPLVIFSLVAAPVIFGIGLDAVKSGHTGPGWALLIASGALLLLGIYVEYFRAPKKKK
jgi:hypothetical protein